jgi:hypothetical protein
MGISYEWLTGASAYVIDAAELRENTEDDSDITDTTIGVAIDNGGGGALFHGERADLIDYFTNIVTALRATGPSAHTAPGGDDVELCERCKTDPITDDDAGLCDDCTDYNAGRVVL